MPSDYRAIRSNNVLRYGTDIGRIGKMLLADRYTVRTHFIFELLQNAEDALARRARWEGSRSVRFHLTEKALRVSHFGRPFDDPDVRGICGIDESKKISPPSVGSASASNPSTPLPIGQRSTRATKILPSRALSGLSLRRRLGAMRKRQL